MTVKEYAKSFGLTEQAVYMRIKRGKLEGKKIGNYQLVRAN